MVGRIANIVVGLALIAGAAVLYTEPFTPVLAPTDIPNFTRSEAPPLAGDNDPRLVRQPGEAALAFATRVNDEISRAFAHCTPAESVAHGWLLYGLHAAGFTYVTEQGLLTSRRNLCGFCHQAAHIEAAALRRHGIEAQVLGLNGHVVVRAIIDGATYYLDPDFGVGPFRGDAADFPARLAAAYAPISDDISARAPSFYLSRDDNQPYYSDGYLEAVERQQALILVIQDLLLLLAVAVGAICIWRGLRPARDGAPSAEALLRRKAAYSPPGSPVNSAGSKG
jgi:hypothetical protein